MKIRKRIIASITLTLILGLLMPTGQILASSYERYVLPGPNGGRVFLFAGPSRTSLALLLNDIYKDNLLLQRVVKLVIPGLLDLVPGTPATPPAADPVPAPVPEPDPVPAPGSDSEATPEPQPTPETPDPVEPPAQEPDPKPEPKPAPEPAPEPKPVEGITAEEQLMVSLVNQERAKAGLKPLQVDLRLVELARMKSKDMIDLNYFSHTSPTYGSPFDMMKKAGVDYYTAGENLAGASTVERAHEALMQSDGHRRNILNPAFTHIGIGIVKGGSYGMMFTQMFIGQ